jgi:hypothetical protein
LIPKRARQRAPLALRTSISKIDTISQDATGMIEKRNVYRRDFPQPVTLQSKAPTIVFDIPVKSNRLNPIGQTITYRFNSII